MTTSHNVMTERQTTIHPSIDIDHGIGQGLSNVCKQIDAFLES